MTAGNRSAAVKAQRSPNQVEGDGPKAAFYRTLDFFPAPPSAARAGEEVLHG